jgi:F-box-like
MYVYIFHNSLHRALTGDAARVTIDMLPDLALLEIFDHCVDDDLVDHDWHPLVHVCQRWRNIVFASPRRLNLRLLCTARTSVKEMLDIWPPLPIAVWSGDFHVEEWDVDYRLHDRGTRAPGSHL